MFYRDNYNNKGEQYSPPGRRKSLFSYENVWRGNKPDKNKQSNCVEIFTIDHAKFRLLHCISGKSLNLSRWYKIYIFRNANIDFLQISQAAGKY